MKPFNAPVQNNNNSGKQKSDLFINCWLVSSQIDPVTGEKKRVKIQQGIGIQSTSKLGRSLLAKVKAEGNDEHEFEMVATIHLVDENDDSTYEL